MAKAGFKSVSDYIASKPERARRVLKLVRNTIRKAIPAAKEGISYQIPVCKVDGVPVLFFAGWKEHYSLYPASEALVAAFKEDLARYEVRKGTIRFPLAEPVPVNLIDGIARFRGKQLKGQEKKKGGKQVSEDQLERVRRICAAMPSVSEKLSHGAPTFFAQKDKGVFTMFVDNHHEDGRLAVWVPAPPGIQSELISDDPDTYFKPPYVGSNGWIGIELNRIRDEALQVHIREAWELAGRKKKKAGPQL